MDSAFLHFWRKSILWHMQFKPMVHPLKPLGSAIIGEGDVVNDLNTTQVAYNQWREVNEQHNIIVSAVVDRSRPLKEKESIVDISINCR